MTAPLAANHARQSAKRYRRLRRLGRCMCGRRARAGRVKCRRCALADNRRSKARYATLVHLASLADKPMVTVTYPHHD